MALQPDTATAPAAATPAWLAQGVARLEGDARIDPLADALDGPAAVAGEEPAGSFLRGEWLGHALHPLMTDFPLGCWMSAGILDLVGGRKARPAAQRLVAAGLLAVPLTAASGLADYGTIGDHRVKRVGAVHGLGNTVVALSYLASWRARRKGHHLRGVWWGLAGGGFAIATGYLGGHLSFGRGVGAGVRGMALEDAGGEEIIDLRTAAALLDVPPQQVDVLVEEGLLRAVGDTAQGRSFRKADVLAARLVGG
jgi:uncharacterized membrane protein